jgi:hypothetical protein
MCRVLHCNQQLAWCSVTDGSQLAKLEAPTALFEGPAVSEAQCRAWCMLE